MKKELWMIWKNPETRRRYLIGSLIKHNDNYSFKYILEKDILGFDYFPGFNDLNKIYNNSELFTNIANRLPNSNRPDYYKILEYYGLSKNSSDMEILEKTRGRLITDTFEFVQPFGTKNLVFDVAATRYSNEFNKCKNDIKIGDFVTLELDSENIYDENAIIVKYGNNKIGYVPRCYTFELAKLLRKKVEYNAYVENLKIGAQIIDEEISICLNINC